MKNEIVLASSNKGKIKEFTEIFNKISIKVIPQTNYQIPDAEETGLSFIENAILKARHCSSYTNLPSIADDSGLSVEALNGQPGIYSARYAGENKNDIDNINKLLDAMKQNNNRKASFHCCIAYVENKDDPTPLIFIGKVDGFITDIPSGECGFGYDPIFTVDNKRTFAEIPKDEKNAISHRAIAINKLISYFIK